MPRITPSNMLRSIQRCLPGIATRHKAVSPAPRTAWVDMGHSLTLNGGHSTLSTQHLSYCSALAVLSDWNGRTFHTRTLMHLTGSNLELGLLYQDAGELIATLKESLASGGKVIWVGGVDSQSDYALAMSLNQSHAGGQPLRDLFETPGVSTVIAGASGIEIQADGTFTLTENIGRGVLSEQEVEGLSRYA
ncbi:MULTISPECIES: hypothetical protein [Pseudomonas]|jgi:hypothetical protein|uniref:Uncharacterized protein n=1 Tax=Pseudomonas reactans TaxID=117680 RepID=A0A7Y8KLA9_9PSED|nr:hypothetical protein [Pseudomonas reactans]NWD84228.1 hypothetical protein [Pseudomonas reactans]NWE92155.1 hypothetical protein [Pseudomonas reactans]